MPGIRIGFVKVPVTDLVRSAAFFRDVVGLAEDFVVPEYGWAQLATETVPLCLYVAGQGGGEGAPGIDTGIQLRVDDARGVHARLLAGGARPGALVEGDDGTVSFAFADPDGNRFQVAQVG